MGDRNGATLEPGDWVCYQTDVDGLVLATVVRELGSGGYLIELDPPAVGLLGTRGDELPEHLGTSFDRLGTGRTPEGETLEVKGEALVCIG